MKTALALAPFATDPSHTKGRLIQEEESLYRTIYQRDRDRVTHSAAFRRLEYKTQVFVNHEGDHYRTRLTHTIEVAQIARSVSRVLGANEDLAETLALAHDLGHPAFGHAGETALNELMAPYGGFNHNAQTIKILTHLEQRYAGFDGLNLTWETLEGIAKHNGPLLGKNERINDKNLPEAILACNEQLNLQLDTHASLEAQIAAISDDIAYNNHDLEDGLRADLFTIEDLFMLPVVGEMFKKTIEQHPFLPREKLVHESIRQLVGMMVRDLLHETTSNINKHGVQTPDDVRMLSSPLACFSKEMEATHQHLKQFLMKNMYRHHKVKRMASNAGRVLRELFETFMADPDNLPHKWQRLIHNTQIEAERAVIICDYIAGMTDRFALQEHASLFNMSPQTTIE